MGSPQTKYIIMQEPGYKYRNTPEHLSHGEQEVSVALESLFWVDIDLVKVGKVGSVERFV